MQNLPKITNAVYSEDYNPECVSEPLLILLHGWGSNEHDLPGLAEVLANQLDKQLQFVSVRAPFSAASPGEFEGGYAWGYAWFVDAVVERSKRLKEAKVAGDIFLNWLELEQNKGKISKDRPIILLGFSQGGAMVCHLLTREELKDKIVGAIMLSGYLPFDCENADSQSNSLNSPQKQIPIFHGWGDADEIVEKSESIRAKNWFEFEYNDLTDISYSRMQHSICLQETKDISDFLRKF